MATKKTAAVAAEKEVKPAKKACGRKACATKTTAEKTPAKKAPAKKAAAKKNDAVVYVNAENAGFRAGDVYQTLAAAKSAMTVADLAKAAKVSEQDVLLGLGWLLKEGKVASTQENKIVLA